MFRPVRILYVALCMLQLVKTGFAQYPTMHEIQNFGPSTYKWHNQNWRIGQDTQGLLYIANGDGLLVFNGVNWLQYSTEKLTSVLSLDFDRKGRIFQGGVQEFGYFAPDQLGNLEHYPLSEDLPDSLQNFGNIWVTVALEDKVLFQADNALYVYEDEVVKTIPARNEFVTGIKVDDRFYVEDLDIGISYLNKDRLIPLPGGDSICEYGIAQMLSLNDHEMLVITSDQGLLKWNHSSGKIRVFKSGFDQYEKMPHFFCGIKLKDGNFAFGTLNQGIVVMDKDGKIQNVFSNKRGLSSGRINDLFEDREGNLWAAMNKGISRIGRSSPITKLNDGDSYSGILNTIRRYKGDLFLGTNEGFFRCISPAEGGTGEVLPEIDCLSKDHCFDMLPIDSTMFVGTTRGLFYTNGTDYEMLNEDYARALASLKGAKIPTFAVGGRNDIRLFQKQDGNWNELFTIEDIGDEILRIEYDMQSSDSLVIWAGTFSSGVLRIAVHPENWGHQLRSFSKNAGFYRGEYVIPYIVNDSMRFITKFHTIYKFNEKEWKFGLDSLYSGFLNPEETAFFIYSDANGLVYIEASGPIVVIHPEKVPYMNDRQALRNLKIGYINNIFIDEEQVAWLAGEEGLVRYNPYQQHNEWQPYQVMIHQVSTTSDSLLFAGFHGNRDSVITEQPDTCIKTLAYTDNALVFKVAATFYQQTKEVEYQYQLWPKNKEWTNWRDETQITYANLAPGDYTFKVKARNIFGIESTITSYRFIVAAPWYRTIWAYSLYVISGFLLFVIIIRLNSRRLKMANQKLQAIIKEKTAEIIGQRDQLAIQKQMVEEQRDIVAVKNKEVVDSINYARRLQEAILPPIRLIDEYLGSAFVYYQPKAIVAGDFYFLEPKGDMVFFAAADCTGHGVPGALVSVVCSNVLNKTINELQLTDPAQILNEARSLVISRFVHSESEVKDGMDIALCRLNTKTLELSYAGAYSPLWIIRKNENAVTEIKANKQPVGVSIKPTAFVTHNIQLYKGDRLYIFSDGFSDQFGGEKGKKFKSGNFKRLLLQLNKKPMKAQKKALKTIFENWKGDLEQVDDVCVIGVEI